MLQESQVERGEHQDDSNVHQQPLPEPMPEEQDVDGDYGSYQREHIKHRGCLSSHPSFLLRENCSVIWRDELESIAGR